MANGSRIAVNIKNGSCTFAMFSDKVGQAFTANLSKKTSTLLGVAIRNSVSADRGIAEVVRIGPVTMARVEKSKNGENIVLSVKDVAERVMRGKDFPVNGVVFIATIGLDIATELSDHMLLGGVEYG